jgi:hypothetical protein
MIRAMLDSRIKKQIHEGLDLHISDYEDYCVVSCGAVYTGK